MKKMLIMLGSLVLVLSLVGCIEKSGNVSSSYGPSANDNSEVVATINDSKITADMLNQRAMQMSMMYGEYYAQPEGKLEVLEQMVNDQLLMQEVAKRGMENDPQLASELREYKIQMDQQYDRYREHLLKGKLVESVVPAEREVSDEEAEEFYNLNPEKFADDAKVTASHILVKTKDVADDIMKKLEQGESFAKLAREHSIDEPTSKEGGSLGELTRGMMYPELDEAIFKLPEGAVEPVELQTGFYKGMYSIIKIDKIVTGKSHTFAEIKDKVKEAITQKEIRENYQAFIKELEAKANVKSYPEKISESVGYSHPPMSGENVDAGSVPNDATHRKIKNSGNSDMPEDATHGKVKGGHGDATHTESAAEHPGQSH